MKSQGSYDHGNKVGKWQYWKFDGTLEGTQNLPGVHE
jgi:hypothetical protein